MTCPDDDCQNSDGVLGIPKASNSCKAGNGRSVKL